MSSEYDGTRQCVETWNFRFCPQCGENCYMRSERRVDITHALFAVIVLVACVAFGYMLNLIIDKIVLSASLSAFLTILVYTWAVLVAVVGVYCILKDCRRLSCAQCGLPVEDMKPPRIY